MKNKPLISIIINCFNGEKYLKDCLISVLNQSYTNWEVIFWDNQSSDNSKRIFLELKDERFKYYNSNNHTPLYEARNNAIKKSSGNIIAFLDTDDWWEKNKLEKQVPLFENEKIGMVYSNCYLFFEKKNKKKIYIKKTLKSGNITNHLFKSYEVGITTVLLKKKAFDSVAGFNNKYNIIGDFDLIMRLSTKYQFNCIQEPLAYYRIHDKNFSILNSMSEIDELQNWINDHSIISNELLKPHLYRTKQRIDFLKTIKLINEKEMIKAIKKIILFPISINKIKLILYFIFPKRIIDIVNDFKNRNL
jgi:glycosyltransferase involved in cell wall biosynthesis